MEQINCLLDWGKNVGITYSDELKFRSDQERGVYGIYEGDNTPRRGNLSIEVPNHAIISNNLAERVFGWRDNGLLKIVVSLFKFGAGDETIFKDPAIRDLREKFSPYLKSLPDVVNSPLLWNPLEITLLEHTNLANGYKEKLFDLFGQWIRLLDETPTLSDYKDSVAQDIKYFKEFQQLDDDTIYNKLLLPVVEGTFHHWCSFSSFLWSHLIFTSRAFPEYIINKGNCEPHEVILLPILDLLNHDYESKVLWSTDRGSAFIYQNLEDIETLKQGQEIFNNYGPKGNEELLTSYGFVLEDNVNDIVLLKIKLPLPLIAEILAKEPSIKLPTLDDYTTYAFDDNSTKIPNSVSDIEKYKDGIIYVLNSSNNEACLEPLLQLFTFISQRPSESSADCVRPKFQGLQSLRVAIQHKLNPLSKKTLPDCKLKGMYRMSPYREKCAAVYKNGQISILKQSISTLKKVEVAWLSQCKSSLLTVSKIMKNDPKFFEAELASYMSDTNSKDITFDSTFDLLVLWIVIKIKSNTFTTKHSWVKAQYQSYVEPLENSDTIDEDIVAFHNTYFTDTSAVDISDLNKAFNFVSDNTFTRSSSSQETILVRASH
ncbi:protein-lysine N-methyltransferase KNAG_0D01100 [Huiozyma naganishii CBS 8797]|uniref:SET domain-containing protein n=1 Tax=Huiozyma naganishii (strain ATCC MYA-139 / BCRC 22969 / CBS 8797 / KCTC 17520 / NBRC 10181 / NCYC 3082 / Yp74L-3) TaxID=1071383 RepID=J7RXN7_HUIN7|nr:hypothetical protein KNAG_0D01100 [Kazachstania naganishii CBS 8797]CCK69862.1 hypothetical protein KNAG_0D01100 [Kazachstania naganishii CBS 8797]